MDFARRVAESLNLCGPSNIQCKWDGNEVSLIEVNPRFSGGIPLTIEAGADFPAWLVEMRAGRTIAPRIGQFQSGLTMMSFEDSVFARSEQLQPARQRIPRRYSRARSTTAYVN